MSLRIVADTNILVRFLIRDDEAQFSLVCLLFERCEEIVVPAHVFCELVWVLRTAYRIPSANILEKISDLMQCEKIIARQDEINAGLRVMRKGGDFADGINAYTGRLLSSNIDSVVFVSFDKKAVDILNRQGIYSLLPQEI